MVNTGLYQRYSSSVSNVNNYSNYYYKTQDTFRDVRNNTKKNTIEDSTDKKYVNTSKNLEKYNKCKVTEDESYSEFNDKFSKLKDSSLKLKSYSKNGLFYENDYDKDNDKPVSDDNSVDDGSYENTLISAAKEFVSDYNDAIEFLNRNESSSEEIKNLSQSYKDIKYNSDKLDKIGLDIDEKTGLMSLNESKFSRAIKTDLKNVSNTIGNHYSGVASKTYDMTNAAMTDSNLIYATATPDSEEINSTYFYNPSNSSILQTNAAYSSGILLNCLA